MSSGVVGFDLEVVHRDNNRVVEEEEVFYSVDRKRFFPISWIDAFFQLDPGHYWARKKRHRPGGGNVCYFILKHAKAHHIVVPCFIGASIAGRVPHFRNDPSGSYQRDDD